jgi:hypothetical protein
VCYLVGGCSGTGTEKSVRRWKVTRARVDFFIISSFAKCADGISVVKSVRWLVEAYGILVAIYERIRPLGRAVTIGDDNIKMDPK